MTCTDAFLLELLDERGGKAAIDGHCQKCGDEVRLLVDLVDGVPVVDSVADDGAGVKFYSFAGKPEFLCGSCVEAGERLGSPCEIYTRCVGYYAPRKRMNRGKQAEVSMRKTYDLSGVTA
jgi:hypothetical protein